VGPVNLKLRLTPTAKPIMVHVNRVKHLTEDERQSWNDSKKKRSEEEEEEDDGQQHEEQPQERGRAKTRPLRRPRPRREEVERKTTRRGRRRTRKKKFNKSARLIWEFDSSSSDEDSEEDRERMDSVPRDSSPEEHQTPDRRRRTLDESSDSSDMDVFMTPQADRRYSPEPAHSGEFYKESSAADRTAFMKVTGRVTRHRAAAEDIEVPTHQQCVSHRLTHKDRDEPV